MTAIVSDTIAKPRLRVERLARVCVVLMGVVVIASAFLRLHGASDALLVAWSRQLALARGVHRVAATLVLLGALVIWWKARRDRRTQALVAAGIALSVLGVVAGASRAAPVVVLNLIGGFAMLALCAALATPRPHAAASTHDVDSNTRSIARSLLAIVFIQAAAGAWASAAASADCGFMAGCGALPLAHRAAGVLLASMLIVFGARVAWRERRTSAAALALFAFLSLLIGVLAAGFGSGALPLLTVVHNALAAAMVVTLVRLAREPQS